MNTTIYSELNSLGFFDWLDEKHNLRDTDMTPEYLDSLELDDIHRTVGNAMAFKWFREKYSLYTELHKKFDGIGVSIILSEYRHDMRQDKEVEYHIPKYFGTIYKSYEEAELACLEKLCEIVENKSE